jgi:hypothetical protein
MAFSEAGIRERSEEALPKSSGFEAGIVPSPSDAAPLPTFAELNHDMGRKVLEELAKQERPVAYGTYLRIMRHFMIPDDSALDILYNLGHDITPDTSSSIVFPDDPRPVSWAS